MLLPTLLPHTLHCDLQLLQNRLSCVTLGPGERQVLPQDWAALQGGLPTLRP